jgi:hypothetical protein
LARVTVERSILTASNAVLVMGISVAGACPMGHGAGVEAG